MLTQSRCFVYCGIIRSTLFAARARIGPRMAFTPNKSTINAIHKSSVRRAPRDERFFTTSDTPRSAPPHQTACPALPIWIIFHHPLLNSAGASLNARMTLLLAWRGSSCIRPRSCTGRSFASRYLANRRRFAPRLTRTWLCGFFCYVTPHAASAGGGPVSGGMILIKERGVIPLLYVHTWPWQYVIRFVGLCTPYDLCLLHCGTIRPTLFVARGLVHVWRSPPNKSTINSATQTSTRESSRSHRAQPGKAPMFTIASDNLLRGRSRASGVRGGEFSRCRQFAVEADVAPCSKPLAWQVRLPVGLPPACCLTDSLAAKRSATYNNVSVHKHCAIAHHAPFSLRFSTVVPGRGSRAVLTWPEPPRPGSRNPEPPGAPGSQFWTSGFE